MNHKILPLLLSLALTVPIFSACSENARPSGSTSETSSYFEENDLAIQYTAGDGFYTLENGGSYFTESDESNGSDYTTAPLVCKITVDSSENTGDGYREITFTAVRTFPETDYPSFSSGVTYAAGYCFYDYYTGSWLPDTDNFRIGNDSYRFDFESAGSWVDVTIETSTDFQHDPDSSGGVWSTTVTARMPEDYDGLVFAIHPEPPSYAEYQEITANSELADSYLPLLESGNYDPYKALFCRIL